MSHDNNNIKTEKIYPSIDKQNNNKPKWKSIDRKSSFNKNTII